MPEYVQQVTGPETVRTEELGALSIAQLARVIRADWKKPYFEAVPYLNAMRAMESIRDDYGMDSGKSVVLYFLSNATTWRGPVARAVKAELNKRCKEA